MAEFRQCTLCGRNGVRGFTPMGGGGVICTANRSCSARRQAYNRTLDRAIRKAKRA